MVSRFRAVLVWWVYFRVNYEKLCMQARVSRARRCWNVIGRENVTQHTRTRHNSASSTERYDVWVPHWWKQKWKAHRAYLLNRICIHESGANPSNCLKAIHTYSEAPSVIMLCVLLCNSQIIFRPIPVYNCLIQSTIHTHTSFRLSIPFRCFGMARLLFNGTCVHGILYIKWNTWYMYLSVAGFIAELRKRDVDEAIVSACECLLAKIRIVNNSSDDDDVGGMGFLTFIFDTTTFARPLPHDHAQASNQRQQKQHSCMQQKAAKHYYVLHNTSIVSYSILLFRRFVCVYVCWFMLCANAVRVRMNARQTRATILRDTLTNRRPHQHNTHAQATMTWQQNAAAAAKTAATHRSDNTDIN